METHCDKFWFDYDSARQVSWAYKVILDELDSGEKRLAGDTQLAKHYQALEDQLKLRLYPCQGEIAEHFLPRYFPAFNKYTPAEFRRNFDAL